MKNPIVNENLSDGEEPIIDANATVNWDDDNEDPIVAEIRRYRYARSALFGFDMKREHEALKVMTWAAARKVESFDWRNPHGPREVELPADLTGLIPDRDDLVEKIRRMRVVDAQHEPDLTAYNEDARRRALVLGFPAESFVVTADEVKSSQDAYEAWRRQTWNTETT